ncbi:MAG TPA: Rpn family recombination-promoting nuclease/putative transposase [Kofleriaceae bacterium]
MPAALRELIAWDTLHGESGSFVDPALADHHIDLLFSARLRTDATELIHVLLEDQSTADPAMPLRTLSYRTRVWNRCRKERPDVWLPPILAVLVSHVPSGWTSSRTLDDMFDPSVRAIPGLVASIPRSSLIIDDLAHLSNEDLQARSLGAFQKLALWLLRDARAPRRLLDSFDTWIVTFAEAERAPAGVDATTALLTYMFRVIDPGHHDQLRAKIGKLGTHVEEIAMTIAEQWREEGIAKGREEGRIAALRSQLSAKFGSQALDATCEARLQAATPAAVDHYLQRVLVADSLAAVFED